MECGAGATPLRLRLTHRGRRPVWVAALMPHPPPQHSSLSLTHYQWSQQHLRPDHCHWPRGLREDVGPWPRQRLDLLHLGRGLRGVWPHLPSPDLPAGPHGRVQL